MFAYLYGEQIIISGIQFSNLFPLQVIIYACDYWTYPWPVIKIIFSLFEGKIATVL